MLNDQSMTERDSVFVPVFGSVVSLGLGKGRARKTPDIVSSSRWFQFSS